MQKDRDALAQAFSKAQQHHREAEVALASVQQAVGDAGAVSWPCSHAGCADSSAIDAEQMLGTPDAEA